MYIVDAKAGGGRGGSIVPENLEDVWDIFTQTLVPLVYQNRVNFRPTARESATSAFELEENTLFKEEIPSPFRGFYPSPLNPVRFARRRLLVE